MAHILAPRLHHVFAVVVVIIGTAIVDCVCLRVVIRPDRGTMVRKIHVITLVAAHVPGFRIMTHRLAPCVHHEIAPVVVVIGTTSERWVCLGVGIGLEW
jgi:hypothetical protein